MRESVSGWMRRFYTLLMRDGFFFLPFALMEMGFLDWAGLSHPLLL
jgi:hypothetical protein